LTGSRAYERFTGSQIAKIYQTKPDVWANTRHISLVSSFVASVFLGKIAPIEVSDASGMNLMSIHTNKWDERLLKACGGEELRTKLAGEPALGGTSLGTVSKWWIERHGFNKDCIVAPFCGDNPSSIVSLATPGDAILSLGTSTTLLVSIPPSPTSPVCTTTSHILSHPTTDRAFIAMLCYKNGGLTREQIRDRFASANWDAFNTALRETSAGNNGYLGFYFPLSEIIPDGVIGEHFYHNGQRIEASAFPSNAHPRAILESQLLSIRSRLELILPQVDTLHRCIVTGGSSSNPVFRQIISNILHLPVYIASTSASATVGGALLAKFAWWRSIGNKGSFEDMRKVEPKVEKVAEPQEEVKRYTELLPIYQQCERDIIERCSRP
jgi:xylulokinase